jgi:parvulin-like peptidyl-prolyl isomerase
MLLIAYGYYADRIAPRGDIVLQVGEHQYTYAYLEQRIKSDVAQGRFNLKDTANSLTATIARIQREELDRIIGRQHGITVSEAELDDGIRDDLNLDPAITRNELAPLLRSELRRIDLPLDDYLAIIETRVIENKVRAELTASLPAEAEQVNLLYIEGGSQANTILAKQALDEGADFGTVAAQFSQDTNTKADGVLGWVPREALDPELADVAFSITGRSGIIETKENFYIIEVLGKETRAIDPSVVDNIGHDEYDNLLKTAIDETPVVYNLSETQIVNLANAVGGTFGGG